MAVLQELVPQDMAAGHEADQPGSAAPSLAPRLTRRRSSVTKPPAKPTRTSRKKNPPDSDRFATAASNAVNAVPYSMSLPARRLPLLICSIGNPGTQFSNTFHSAGHTVLNRLADRLGYPQFRKDRAWGNGLVSKAACDEGEWTLWQSTAYMNDSGKGVRAAYAQWVKHNSIADGEGRLVVVHDELEKPLGSVSLKVKEGASAKGHNGLKSIMQVFSAGGGNVKWARIGVGIGRPESRQSDDVARYVLRKMTAEEMAKVEGSVEDVVKKLREVQGAG